MTFGELVKFDDAGNTVPAQYRTDASFRSRVDIDHHLIEMNAAGVVPKVGPPRALLQLEQLPIDMVDCFTIDAMHCFCRGVMVRLFHFLTGEKVSGAVTIKKTDWVNKIGEAYTNMKFPVEFMRRPSSFGQWDTFKCTELRMFALYGMEILIRKFCHVRIVQQMLYCLVIGMRIISDPRLYREEWRLAQACFDTFLVNSANYFGDHFVTLAIHQLRHLPKETVRLGLTAWTFSCFKFENTLGIIKRAVKSKMNPLLNVSKFVSQQNTFRKQIFNYSFQTI